MKYTKTIGIHLTDTPLKLYNNESLIKTRIVMGGSRIGRVLFKDVEEIGIIILGSNVTLCHCLIEHL